MAKQDSWRSRLFFFLLPNAHLLRGWVFRTFVVLVQIEHYGGYEHVARRLNLGYHYEDEVKYQEKVRDELKLQNERYGKIREQNLERQRNKLAKLKVRLHKKRLNYEREMKLADGLRNKRVPKVADETRAGTRQRR